MVGFLTKSHWSFFFSKNSETVSSKTALFRKKHTITDHQRAVTSLLGFRFQVSNFRFMCLVNLFLAENGDAGPTAAIMASAAGGFSANS